MKSLFSLINLVVGLLFLVIGLGIFLSVSNHPQNMGAGVIAVCIAGACLWLARQSSANSQPQLS